MQFNNEISKQLDLIDKCLTYYGKPNLINNSDFEILRPFKDVEDLIVVNHIRNGSIKFEFLLSTGEFRLDIDKAEEILHYTYEQFLLESNNIQEYIHDLFSSEIIITYIGSSYTIFKFFKNNSRVRRIKYIDGIFFFIPLSYKRIKYAPLYSVKSNTPPNTSA